MQLIVYPKYPPCHMQLSVPVRGNRSARRKPMTFGRVT